MSATRAPSTNPSGGVSAVQTGAVHTNEVQELIARRSFAVHARTRVAEAIRALALDICGGDDTLSLADRAWLREQIAGSVNEATEEALRVLVEELSATLRSAPERIRPSLMRPLVTRTDFE